MKKQTKKNLILALAFGVVIILGAYLIITNNTNKGKTSPDSNQEESQSQEEKDTESQNILPRVYENQTLGFSFNYPEGYGFTQDNISKDTTNTKMIIKNLDRRTTLTIYTNISGIDPDLADKHYLMEKSGDEFIISEKQDGFIPERDTSGTYSVIADFGVTEGTSKVSGKSYLAIWNSDINNKYLEDFENILESFKEI